MTDYAVYVKNVSKRYGKNVVLDGLCMTVPRGSIYGLLGASGCGKTTLLSGIVGRKPFDSGDCLVMGAKPGTPGSGVPGPIVGYMPQEIALVAEFTIRDAVFYFGRILDMRDEEIEERFKELKDLLDLPPEDRFLKHCSGGQQRRVSFACAMVHKPDLLILDEPTVGLDPLLRESIWNYLVKISKEDNVAVLITTHYIEETRQANRIGLMRNGKLLAEESPERLMNLFGTDTLEEVFLILSRQQEEGRLRDNGSSIADDLNNSVINGENNIQLQNINKIQEIDSSPSREKKYKNYGALSLNKNRLRSLTYKNTVQFLRNSGAIVFTFSFPIFEMLAFLVAVGGDVRGIKLAVVNSENYMLNCNNYTGTNGTAIPYDYTSCHFMELGCRFLDQIEDPMIHKIYYTDVDKALRDVTHGKVVGVLYITENFTEAFESRFNDIINVPDSAVEYSQIKVWLDMSDRQIGTSIKFKLMKKYLEFSKSLVTDCNLPEKIGDIPMRFHYEYGSDADSFTVFMVPGVLLTIMSFLGTTSSATIIINDRLEGVWDRSIVAGVSSLEIVLTHFLMQIVIVLLQVLEVMIVTFVLWGIDYAGSLATIWVLVVLQGIVGMCFGFWISIIADSHSAANVVVTGLFYPMILLCGMIWPLEGQPIILRTISMFLPFTLPIISLRDVIQKGYAIYQWEVLSGILITLAWILCLSVISVYSIRRKQ